MFKRAISHQRWAVVSFVVALGWAGTTQADPVSLKTQLTGEDEVPPVQTTGSGLAEFEYDRETRTVKWTISYSGLTGPATMAHLHGPAQRGEKAPVLVWLSKQGSSAASPITGQTTLTPAQAEQFAAGRWYVNVHTQAHPGGEIRGQVTISGN